MSKAAAAKIPPQNLDAEKSLIGAVLIDEEVLADVSENVKAGDFYDKNHGIIFGEPIKLFSASRFCDDTLAAVAEMLGGGEEVSLEDIA
jgi:replicative DNA helicase